MFVKTRGVSVLAVLVLCVHGISGSAEEAPPAIARSPDGGQDTVFAIVDMDGHARIRRFRKVCREFLARRRIDRIGPDAQPSQSLEAIQIFQSDICNQMTAICQQTDKQSADNQQQNQENCRKNRQAPDDPASSLEQVVI